MLHGDIEMVHQAKEMKFIATPEICKKLGKRATLHPLDTADHGFRILKRSRRSEEDVFVEMARIVREWASKLK